MASAAAHKQHDKSLLTEQDGSPYEIINPYNGGPIVLICEHASNKVPHQLNKLGLSDELLDSHVGWDPGARELAIGLSSALNAPLIAACFSRLVYDCNRPPWECARVRERPGMPSVFLRSGA